MLFLRFYHFEDCFSEFGFPHTQSTPLFADNTSVIRITENLVLHEQTKHIEVDFHFIQD